MNFFNSSHFWRHFYERNTTKGITLVALVITIAVLSILAGITITMISGDGDIVKKAQNMADKTNEAQNKQKNDIKDLSGILGDSLIPTARMGKKVDNGILYANFIAKTDDNKDVKVPVPGGYKVVQNLQNSNKINDGIVIQDELGNQFVWVPVPDEDTLNTMYGTDSNGKNHGKLYTFTSSQKSKLNWTEDETTKVMNISNANLSREPNNLPNTSDGDGTVGDASKGIEQLKNVIGITADSDATDENQNILDKWMDELQTSFDNMIASVKEYKGFYIGRYETGSWSKRDKKDNIPQVQKDLDVGYYTNVNWYYQYAQTKNLKKMKNSSNEFVDNPNVTTNMIWGCQFDRTLEWIAGTNEGGYSLLTDSKSWGNYKDSTGAAATNSGSIQYSGSNDAWQKNNIYDLAGNVWDWTIEASGVSLRVLRGGNGLASSSGLSAYYRHKDCVWASSNVYGSRSTLYINPPTDTNT